MSDVIVANPMPQIESFVTMLQDRKQGVSLPNRWYIKDTSQLDVQSIRKCLALAYGAGIPFMEALCGNIYYPLQGSIATYTNYNIRLAKQFGVGVKVLYAGFVAWVDNQEVEVPDVLYQRLFPKGQVYDQTEQRWIDNAPKDKGHLLYDLAFLRQAWTLHLKNTATFPFYNKADGTEASLPSSQGKTVLEYKTYLINALTDLERLEKIYQTIDRKVVTQAYSIHTGDTLSIETFSRSQANFQGRYKGQKPDAPWLKREIDMLRIRAISKALLVVPAITDSESLAASFVDMSSQHGQEAFRNSLTIIEENEIANA